MARSPAPRPVQTVFDLGHNHQQQDTRNAQGWPLRASHNRFSSTPIKTHPELNRDDESLTRAWNKVRSGSDCNNEIDLRTPANRPVSSRLGNPGGPSAIERSPIRTLPRERLRLHI